MTAEKHSFINVDELLPQIGIEQVVAYYGAKLPELHRVGTEIRTKCFLNCGKTKETGERALAIKADDPATKWRCHQYGCTKGGNLIGICDLLKPGADHGGRPRGERFKAIAADLQAIVSGDQVRVAPTVEATHTAKPQESGDEQRLRNVPLKDSPNERARALVNLDEKFVTDIAEMNPKASAYFRARPFLIPEVCRKWRMGYLSHDSGGDRAGGTMRGKIVYPMLSERGEVLSWFGRDPSYEEKHAAWVAGGRTGKEPEKFHFVKGFHRRSELFGQHKQRLDELGYRERLHEFGLVVVEGPNDVIRLDCLAVPAIGLCSNQITKEQIAKISRWAMGLSGGRVTLMLDCDIEGEKGAKQALWELGQQLGVTVGWSRSTHNEKFANRQPESLTGEEWKAIAESLAW
ncbi:MAG: hypothetical protein IH991_08475 [Planctomycetes bacterium]|nr:hypothetical protein [Planctomycetota bacterium]